MPTWSELLDELKGAQQRYGPTFFDVVRRKYLTLLAQHTGRETILYATRWTQPGPADPSLTQITFEDVQGFMGMVHGLSKGKGLDLILHSPGGSPEAAESIVQYLRTKFDDIRVIVPHAAMSAATMVACASNRIVLGRHSSLGPIDPQMIVSTPQTGLRVSPAQAILDQFEMAKKECSENPKVLGAWAPLIAQLGPALLVQSINASKLAQELVAEWLERWMFAGESDAKTKAQSIAAELSDHHKYKSHGRPIHRDAAKDLGLVIDDLEQDQVMQDLVLSVFHATTHTFSGTPAAKIIENHFGRAFVRQAAPVPIQLPAGLHVPQGIPIPPGAGYKPGQQPGEPTGPDQSPNGGR